jgi:hypothetical protein
MISPDTIEDVEDAEDDAISCYGYDPDTGQWGWGWVPIETLYEYGREDILRSARLIRDEDEAA